MTMELWDVYDIDRQKTGGLAPRHNGRPLPAGQYHLVVHICLFNQKGQMLIQQRQLDKAGYPGLWDVTAAGSALAGENSAAAAARELWEELGISHDFAKERPHYTMNFPDGFDEVEGIHNRQDFDLGSHTKSQDEFKIQAHVLENKDSTTKLAYSDAQTGDSFIPFVIETAMGVNRAMLAVMLDAYTEEDLPDGKSRVVLKLKPALAPVKAAVIPLARNVPELLTIANNIENDLRKLNIGRIELENSGNIGKNYRRHDEIGTPVCITVDHQTMEDNTVTLRYRDSMAQERVAISDVPQRVMEIITKNEK